MSDRTAAAVTIQVDESHQVSGLVLSPARAIACCTLAHGTGAGMTHPFMATVAEALSALGVATLRFQFPSMENGSRRPDRPALAHATIRAAVDMAHRLHPDLALFAAGKSFGARMTSQAQAECPLPGVRGLVFLGFPLHPEHKPAIERAQHLQDVDIPMLFLQGTRDALADTGLLVPMVAALNPRAKLKLIEHADHSFHVLARSKRTDEQVMSELMSQIVSWIRQMALAPADAD